MTLVAPVAALTGALVTGRSWTASRPPSSATTPATYRPCHQAVEAAG